MPLGENRSCASFLGVCVAEKVLDGYFDNLVRMPYGNVGYDYVCGKGFKIDVKTHVFTKTKLESLADGNLGFIGTKQQIIFYAWPLMIESP